ncbi:LiaI-LiaF-like domain-containing protein [Oceanobacillus halotolerans]|uniref:LiaI-LiaF-like domain-containing protein n=1 Tax=Oceanobacillus halotolerans TaxID=2663380 RepID=UPI0013DC4B2C|nr:DUF5668 domain-containing protein [Oceanobacillus halotolerans]
MKKEKSFVGYILIGVGAYFFIRELRLPIFTDFYSWPTLLIIIGLALILHSYTSKDYQHLFSGTIILGLGIHFHGLNHYSFWIDHWGMYLLIIGIAYIVRYTQTKKGLMYGLLFIGLSIVMIFSIQVPAQLRWINDIIQYIERFWPIILIVVGIYIIKKKR